MCDDEHEAHRSSSRQVSPLVSVEMWQLLSPRQPLRERWCGAHSPLLVNDEYGRNYCQQAKGRIHRFFYNTKLIPPKHTTNIQCSQEDCGIHSDEYDAQFDATLVSCRQLVTQPDKCQH